MAAWFSLGGVVFARRTHAILNVAERTDVLPVLSGAERTDVPPVRSGAERTHVILNVAERSEGSARQCAITCRATSETFGV